MGKKSEIRKAFEKAAKQLEKELGSKQFQKSMDKVVKESGGYKKKKE